jgi:autotransporter-associated beta strand protein
VLTGGSLGLGVAGGGTINTAAGVTATIASALVGGAGSSLTKVGAGTLTLSGANSYSGGTLLNAGTLAVGSASAIGTGTLQMAGGATLRANVPALTLANALSLSSGTATIDTGSHDLGLIGVISGTGTFSKTGAGLLTLSGANTYSGATWIQEGTLRMGGVDVLPNQTAVQVSAGAIFDLSGMTQSVGSLSGTGNVLLGGTTLTAGGNDGSTTFSGTISGAGSLLKTGTDTLTLNGTNTYTSVTQVFGGASSSTVRLRRQ